MLSAPEWIGTWTTSGTSTEVEVHAAAFVVSLLQNGYLDEAADFVDWYIDNFRDAEKLEALLEVTDDA